MTEDPKYDRDKKFTSQDGEMEFLPVEAINAIRMSTLVAENIDEMVDESGDGSDELDEIDEEDLQDLADEEE